jgi:transposase
MRYRFIRSGDRQINRALHTVALCRLQRDERTRIYAERRRAEGKTDREIKGCLKGYIARELNPTRKPAPSALTRHRSVRTAARTQRGLRPRHPRS